MAKPLDYLMAAAVVAVRRRTSVGALPQSRDALREIIEKSFSIELSDVVLSELIIHLRASDLVRIVKDDYAGEIFTVLKTRMDRPSGDLAQLLIKAEWGANDLLRKVFANDRFWSDLSQYVESGTDDFITAEAANQQAPASDRVVTLSHNQASEIIAKSDEIIADVAAMNQIEGEPNLREIVLGQLKAGKDLIEAGSFRVYAIECTLLEGLRFLVKRYERETIAGLASTLIAIICKHIGIDA